MSNRIRVVRTGSTASLFATRALLVLLLTFAAARADTIPPPNGWRIYKTGELDEAAEMCANSAKLNRVVTQSNGSLELTSRGDQYASFHRTPFAGGLLEGKDMGEFGGSLSWLAPDGYTRSQILDENVRSFLRTPYGNFVLTGVDQGGYSSGKVWRLSDEAITPPAVTLVADIGESPQAFTTAPDGSTVIVTFAKMVRLQPPGDVKTITSVHFHVLYPNSVVETPAGVIYVGMRHFVVRLTPDGAAFRTDWLLPADCLEFKRKASDCVCLAP